MSLTNTTISRNKFINLTSSVIDLADYGDNEKYFTNGATRYNALAGINPAYISDLSICLPGTQLTGCTNFTPNTIIDSYSSNAFHGQSSSHGASTVLTHR